MKWAKSRNAKNSVSASGSLGTDARVAGGELGDDAGRGRADVVHVQLCLGQSGDESGEVRGHAPQHAARGQSLELEDPSLQRVGQRGRGVRRERVAVEHDERWAGGAGLARGLGGRGRELVGRLGHRGVHRLLVDALVLGPGDQLARGRGSRGGLPVEEHVVEGQRLLRRTRCRGRRPRPAGHRPSSRGAGGERAVLHLDASPAPPRSAGSRARPISNSRLCGLAKSS